MASGTINARSSDILAVLARRADATGKRASAAVLPSGALAVGPVLPYLVVTRLSPAFSTHMAVRIVRTDAEIRVRRLAPVPVTTVRLHVSPPGRVCGA
jgi:hypothetical protein